MRRYNLENHAQGEHRATGHDRSPPAEARRYQRDGHGREESTDVLQRDHDGADGGLVGVAEIILVRFEGEDAACELRVRRRQASCGEKLGGDETYLRCLYRTRIGSQKYR